MIPESAISASDPTPKLLAVTPLLYLSTRCEHTSNRVDLTYHLDSSAYSVIKVRMWRNGCKQKQSGLSFLCAKNSLVDLNSEVGLATTPRRNDTYTPGMRYSLFKLSERSVAADDPITIPNASHRRAPRTRQATGSDRTPIQLFNFAIQEALATTSIVTRIVVARGSVSR